MGRNGGRDRVVFALRYHAWETEAGRGHGVAVVDAGRMAVLSRLDDFGNEKGRGIAYPVYCVLDDVRSLLFVSNDRAKTLEVLNVSHPLKPRKVGEAFDERLDYLSQLAYDPVTFTIVAASQHANSVTLIDVLNPRKPNIVGSFSSEVLEGATGVAGRAGFAGRL